jgi:hypothetical protein
MATRLYSLDYDEVLVTSYLLVHFRHSDGFKSFSSMGTGSGSGGRPTISGCGSRRRPTGIRGGSRAGSSGRRAAEGQAGRRPRCCWNSRVTSSKIGCPPHGLSLY